MHNKKLDFRVNACLFLATVGFSAVVFASSIPIPLSNGSFESPDVVNLTSGHPTNQNAIGGTQTAAAYTSQTATQTSKYYYGANSVNDPIPYWTVTSANNAGTVYGIWNPISTAYYGTNGGSNGGYTLPDNTDESFGNLASLNSSYGYSYADGYQFAYANLASGGSVTLTYNPSDPNTGNGANSGISLGNYIAGDSYALTVAIGTPLSSNGYQYNYSIIFTDNGVPVATTSDLSPTEGSCTWLQASLAYTAVDTGAIGVELYASNPNSSLTLANFDNVQINDLGPGHAPNTPEPGVLSLLAASLLPLRRRRA